MNFCTNFARDERNDSTGDHPWSISLDHLWRHSFTYLWSRQVTRSIQYLWNLIYVCLGADNQRSASTQQKSHFLRQMLRFLIRVPPYTFTRTFKPRHDVLRNFRTDVRKYVATWLEYSRKYIRPVSGPLSAELGIRFCRIWDQIVPFHQVNNRSIDYKTDGGFDWLFNSKWSLITNTKMITE